MSSLHRPTKSKQKVAVVEGRSSQQGSRNEMDFLIAMAADAPARTSHFLDGTGLSLVIFPLIVIVISVIYQKTKPLDMPTSLPGPTRYFFIGYLHHAISKWYDWPNETLRLCELYKKTWGGPLPKFRGLPGG